MKENNMKKFEENLSPEQRAFIVAEGCNLGDYFAFKSFGLSWKNPAAMALARGARKLGLRAAVSRGSVSIFYPRSN